MNNLFIPPEITVGYQYREDTFTNKLAFVTFKQNGKLRQEKSFQNYISDMFPVDDFPNIPTKGFMLNKHVGGVENSGGWFARKSYMRIYDPRGFEFEIDMDNLEYIMQYSAWNPDEGFLSEFVYAWDGKQRVLLPTNAPEYQQMTQFTEQVLNEDFFNAKKFVVGDIYEHKSGANFVYLGYFDQYDWAYGDLVGKRHHFVEESHMVKLLNHPDKHYETWTRWYDTFLFYANLNKKFLKRTGSVDKTMLEEFMHLYHAYPFCSPIAHEKTVVCEYTPDEFRQYMDYLVSKYGEELNNVHLPTLTYANGINRNEKGWYICQNSVYIHDWADVLKYLRVCYYKIYLANGEFAGYGTRYSNSICYDRFHLN